MTPVRLALVGLGKVARDQHLPTIAASPRFQLVCGASLDGRCPEGATYASVAAMLEAEPEIQAVVLCQPPQARFEAARAALAAGKHVLLEKPPCATVSELDTLKDMALKRGLTLYCAWHSRHAPAVEPARTWLRGRRILSVGISWLEDVRVWHPGQRWIWEAGGLGVFDPGINALSVATLILPPMRLVKGSLSYPANQDSPIAAHLLMEVVGGGPVHASFDFRHEDKEIWDIEVQTDQGQLCISEGGAGLTIDGANRPLPPEAEYASLYARFAQLIAQGACEVDARPLQLVADAFLRCRREVVEPFHET